MGEPEVVEVGVVIPAHDMERWVGVAIESVLGQDVPVQLVVVDDASGDRTVAVATEALAGRPGCEVVANHRIRGVCGARNAGLERLRTPWVLFLDADDFLRAGALEALLAARDERAVALLGAFGTVDEDGRDRPGSWAQQRADALSAMGHPSSMGAAQLARANVMPPPGAQLLSVSALREVGGFDEGHLAAGWSEDAELLARLAARGPVRLVDAEVLAYRVRGGSLSSRPGWRRKVTRSRLTTVRRAPRLHRASVGLAFAARYLELAQRRLAEGLRRGRPGPLVNGVANLALALLFAVAGALATALPRWRPTWSLEPRP